MSIARLSSKLLPCVLLGLALPACGSASMRASVGGVGVSASVATPTVDTSVSVSGSVNTTVAVGTQTTFVPVTASCTEEWLHMPVLLNFATGGAELDAQNRMLLDELWRSARNRSDIRAVRVEGHTDRCGNEGSNMALSQTRAEVVAAELVRLGVPQDRIMTVGYGSTQIRANDNCDREHELSRATNRRVEFSLLLCH
jgi:outer membrane protein OmpA-like peptidoglycan-associated protein